MACIDLSKLGHAIYTTYGAMNCVFGFYVVNVLQTVVLNVTFPVDGQLW